MKHDREGVVSPSEKLDPSEKNPLHLFPKKLGFARLKNFGLHFLMTSFFDDLFLTSCRRKYHPGSIVIRRFSRRWVEPARSRAPTTSGRGASGIWPYPSEKIPLHLFAKKLGFARLISDATWLFFTSLSCFIRISAIEASVTLTRRKKTSLVPSYDQM